MNGFYVSMIFLGILLIIISLISIFLDKRKVFSFIKGFDDKKMELSEIIGDAEQMIDELNRFSDYIVTQMDLKNEELNRNLHEAEARINKLNEGISTVGVSATVAPEAKMAVMETEIDNAVAVSCAAASGSAVSSAVAVNGVAMNGGSMNSGAMESLPIHTADAASAVYGRSEGFKSTVPIKKSDKVIPFKSKYSEVLRLSGEGLGSLEIARNLNMGKGEVELIIGLRK